MNKLIDNATLLNHIRKLLKNGSRGTLFITTANNRSVTLAFEDGTITGISSRGILRGAKALEHLMQVEQASYKFDENMLALPGGMPDPEDVSRILGIQSKAGHVPKSIHANHEMTLYDNNFHERALQILEGHLKEAIGSYAIIVMNELRESSLDELDTFEKATELLNKLVEEIDSKNQAEIFIKTAINDLEELYRSVI